MKLLGKAGGWFRAPGIYLDGYGTQSIMPSDQWTFITYVVDLNVGMTTYFNAIKEGFADIRYESVCFVCVCVCVCV